MNLIIFKDYHDFENQSQEEIIGSSRGLGRSL